MRDSLVFNVAISPNNRWVATGSQDGTCRVWDIQAEDPSANPLILRGGGGRPNFHPDPDQHKLVTTSDDQIRIWNLDLESSLEFARSIAERELTTGERKQFELPLK